MMSTKLLQNVKIEVCDIIMVMINQSFVSGIFPDKLKIAKVVPLYKKNEKNKIENYRPVSLLPSVSKVFERIIHDQLNEYFSSLKLFYKSQYGFRHSHSTELATLELIELIITEMYVKKYPLRFILIYQKPLIHWNMKYFCLN